MPISSWSNHSATIRIPTTKPAPTMPRARRAQTITVNESVSANTVLGTSAAISRQAYNRRGPK